MSDQDAGYKTIRPALILIAAVMILIFICSGLGSLLIKWTGPSAQDTPVGYSEVSGYLPAPTDVAVIADIERVALIKIPAGARDIYYRSGGRQEVFIQVRFTLEAGDLEKFMSSTLCTEPKPIPLTPEPTVSTEIPAWAADPTWWGPGISLDLEGCVGMIVFNEGEGQYSSQDIYVERIPANGYVVYIKTVTD